MVCISQNMELEDMKPVVVLPAYNEEKWIGDVISQIKKCFPEIRMLVIDDGSQDNTVEIAKKSGAEVIRHKINMGKGASLRTGFRYVLENYSGDVIITMDADGQHNPQELHKFLDRYRKYKEGLIIGNRMNDPSGMPFIRWLTNKVTSGIISIIVGVKVPDVQCGYRLIDAEVLRRVNLITSRYDTEVELVVRTVKEGFKIGWVEISSIYRGEVSYINPFVDTVRFIKLLCRILKEKMTK